jgi:hypothetical protein
LSIRLIIVLASQLTLPEAWTASGDGTTYKGITAVSHFSTLPPVPPVNEVEGEVKCVPRRRFLGITREVNHKTSTQVENWIHLLADISSVYGESPGGSKDPVKATEIARKATGYSADHAADQMKLSRELYAYKQSCDYQLRGEQAIKSKSEGEIEKVMNEVFDSILEEVGDWKGWDARSREEQEKLLERLIHDIWTHFGKGAFDKLPERLRRLAGLWHWSGCCMHKDLNTFKGGATQLSAFWMEEGIEGPVKLLSRGREEQKELMGSDTTDCGLNGASGGAAKLADLVGALVRNKVETKGYPEEFRTYAMDQLNYEISFPDTSNTRYQCYGDAATELVRHPDFYIGFLDQHGKKKKRAAGLNHMEKNILKGLEDPATRTELAVFSLYSEAISKPYAISVRGSFNESKNALDLGPAHLQIISHIDILIKNPDLLIGDHTSHETGALYRTHWDQTIINHIHSIRNQLPHLRQALIAFLQGARAKWVDFTKEFMPGSDISDSTAEELLLSFRSPTNDHSEGAGAMWKMWSRRAPSMTTHQKNARLFLQLNSPDIETSSQNLPEPDRAFARKKAREMDAAKLPAKESEAQAKADCEAADEEQREVERLRKYREAKEAEEIHLIEGFQPVLDRNAFLALPDNKPSNDFLKRQLVWHRRVGGDKTLPLGTFAAANKASMKKLVAKALERWNQHNIADVDMVDLGSEDADIDMADLELGDIEDPGTESDTVVIVEESHKNEGSLVTRSPLETTSCHDSPPVLARPRNPLPMRFGCKWDPVDYSCAYDCVFTAFTWIWIHATNTWREKWTQESAIAGLLSGHFRKVLSGLSGPAPDHTVPGLFAEGRDAWRDRLSQRNPTEFPRRGPKYASIAHIFELLANDRNPSYYTTIILSCGTVGCPLKTKNLEARHFMLVPSDWNTSTGRMSSPHHESLEVWIKKHYTSSQLTKTADRCARCQQQFSRKLVFRELTWIWFEVFPGSRHVIIPALKISLGSITFRLATVIYYNGDHYRARFCDPSGTWWFYDGQQYGGRPTLLSKAPDWGDLFQCGGNFNVTALVYCLMD